MLRTLRIKNLAIIKDLSIDFGEGLNILTGETGAGKSIILQSLKFIGGERFDKGLIRSGEKKVFVEAIFEFNAPLNFLREYFDEEDDLREIIVRRELFEDGRNKVFVNGKAFNLSFLRLFSPYLYNIYGQNDQRILTDKKSQLELLDRAANNEEFLEKLEKISSKIDFVKKEIDELNKLDQEKLQRKEFLEYAINEIEEAEIEEGIIDKLKEKRKVYQNSEQIFSILKETLDLIYEGDNSLLSLFSTIENNFLNLSKFKKEWEDDYKKISEFSPVLEDIAYKIRDFLEEVNFSPEELEELESKLAKIERLQKKYGENEEDILSYYEKAKEELLKLGSLEIDIKEKREELEELKREYEKLAAVLSERRKKTARETEKRLKGELEELAMKNAQFKVLFIPSKEKFSPYGREKVEFLFSANIGEELKPLNKIASGGELSRIMLGLKMVFVDGMTDTYIFDEIDSGVGGKTAEKVGEKLKKLSKKAQVLCITHFPQVAAFADNHYKVDKYEKDKRTFAKIKLLSKEERIKEIARMMSGSNISDAVIKSAEELIRINGK